MNAYVSNSVLSDINSITPQWYDNLSLGRKTGDPDMNQSHNMTSTFAFTA